MSQSAMNQAGAESVYFAQPYSLCATGFYFETLAEYRTKVDALRDIYGRPVEEFELQYIDGDFHELFNALSINQASLGGWFGMLQDLAADSDRYLIACHLANNGYTIDELVKRWDNYCIFRGTAKDYAREMYDDCFGRLEWMIHYVDFERLGRDIILGGDITEVEPDILLIG